MIKTDNGSPFGVPKRDVLPIMSLWLKGWGIQPVLNRPKTPQDNATVERMQGTSSRWAEIDKAIDTKDLQDRLDVIILDCLEKYPVKRLGYVTRLSVFPDLYQIPRPFDESLFDIASAYELLASKSLQRKVGYNGTIALYGKTFQAHAKFKRQFVYVKFCTDKIAWNVFEENGTLIKSIPDERFDKKSIILLTACQ